MVELLLKTILLDHVTKTTDFSVEIHILLLFMPMFLNCEVFLCQNPIETDL